MRFAYYDTLSAASKRTYRKSDAIVHVDVPRVAELVPFAQAVQPALDSGDRAATQRACQALVDALNQRLGTPAVEVHEPLRVFRRPPGLSQAAIGS